MALPRLPRTEADAIREAVFLNLITADSPPPAAPAQRPSRHPVFSFVTLVMSGAMHRVSGQPRTMPVVYRDISPQLLAQLRKRFPYVRQESQEKSYKRRFPAWRSKDGIMTGCGSFYWVGPIHREGRNKVSIEGGSKGNIGGDSDYGPSIENRYHLVKRGGRWSIRSIEQVAAAG